MSERSASPSAQRHGTGVRGGVSAGVLVLFVAVALALVLSPEDTASEAGMATIADGEAAAATTPAPPPAVPAVPEVAEVASPPPDAETAARGEPREPHLDDVDAFVTSFDPEGSRDLQTIAVDLDDDGRNEVLAASVAGGSARLDVAVWDGRRYAVVVTDTGGPAETIESFDVRDVTGDGRREIVVAQTSPTRESIALWGVAAEGVGEAVEGGGILRLEARGGCSDGRHVHGFNGASVDDGELLVTCDPSASDDGAPGEEQRYRWDGQAWIHEPPSEDA